MAKAGMKQKYIPGLTKRPDDSEFPPPEQQETDDDVLIRDFMSGFKNPTMAINEYCSRNKIKLEFREESLDPWQTQLPNGFAIRVLMDGLAYPQGQGTNKKEAKNVASRLAFRSYLGIDDFQPEELAPELDDSRFQEVRDLLDIVGQRDLVYKKAVRLDLKTRVTSYTLDVGGLETIVMESQDPDEAIVRAHRKALALLRGTSEEGASFNSDLHALEDTSLFPNPNLALQWAKNSASALEQLFKPLPPELQSMDHHVAVIYLSDSDPANPIGEMVAIGTGSSSVSAANLTCDGRCLIDSSCATIAVRALRKYLAQQMCNCYASQSSIFEYQATGSHRLRLRDGYHFNLYLSHPPEGDYKEALQRKSEFDPQQMAEIGSGGHIPTFADDNHALFHCRNEEGSVELTNQTPDQSSMEEVHHSNEMWVMTTSDKLLRWNILGIQGAALFHFTDPIYFKSIAIGYHPMNDHGHLSRAVCCRVYNDLAESLPPPFVINHPVLHFCPHPLVSSADNKFPTDLSINWCRIDSQPEVVEGNKGRTHQMSPFKVSANGASRLCKAGMHLKWFTDLCKANKGAKLPLLQKCKTSARCKAAAESYQAAKLAFLDHCTQFEIGKWIHAPLEASMFSS